MLNGTNNYNEIKIRINIATKENKVTYSKTIYLIRGLESHHPPWHSAATF